MKSKDRIIIQKIISYIEDVEIYAYLLNRCTEIAYEKMAGANLCYFSDKL